jgi:TolB-like protein
MKHTFRELRQRRIFQVVVSYIVIGWVGLQVADQLADRGIVPELVYRLVLIWFVFGIPVALTLGWYHGEKGRQKMTIGEVSLLLLFSVMALGMSVSTVFREQAMRDLLLAAENPLEMRRIAVTYLRDDSPDAELQYLADGLTEELIAQLSQVRGFSVVSRSGVLQFRGLDVPADSVARVLSAGTIVAGSVEPRGSKLRVHLRVMEGQTGQTFRRVSLDLDSEEGLAARDSVAAAAARLLREWLGEEVRVQQSASGTQNRIAWVLLQRAEKSRKDAEAAFFEGDVEAAMRWFDAADSLLAESEALDENWPDPLVDRAALAYRRARIAQRDPAEAIRLIGLGVGYATEALRRSRTSARAHELRGSLNYYRWLLRLEPDSRQAEALFASARTDLETAVRFDQLLASAYATLSHLRFAEADDAGGVLAAQKAYETDMYLENANTVIWRLFNGNLELGDFAKARHWCDVGVSRFPNDFRLASCELRLMSTPGIERPSIDAAWAVLERVEELAPPNRKESERLRGEMALAGVIARVGRIESSTGLTDSARAVLLRASDRVTPALDPNREMLLIAAYSWSLIGDVERAVTHLQQYGAADPQFFARVRGESDWWWRELQSHPKFRELFGLN